MSKYAEKWLREDGLGTEAIERANAQLQSLQHELLDEYEPESYVKFSDRIDGWLENFDDDADRRAMFCLLPRIFFVGRDQIDSLCRAAFDDVASRWVIDSAGIDVLDAELQSLLDDALTRTWFCPVTDSMKINSFLKLNNLGGHEIRPDWLSLAQLGDPSRIKEFVQRARIERVVLIEDFVGSGSQMSETVQFAIETLPDIPKLVVPLVCCPGGLALGRGLASKHHNLAFEPVLPLSEELFVLRDAQDDEPHEFAVARRLSKQLASKFGKNWADPFGHNDTGALVVLHTNCPDNTLPLIHDRGLEWRAIFPRIARE